MVVGDFNDWGERLDEPMRGIGLNRAQSARAEGSPPAVTFPALAPVFALDRVYMRGWRCHSTAVPRGASWARMSDHLPLVVELELI